MISGFIYGTLTVRYHYPPYKTLHNIDIWLNPEKQKALELKYYEINPKLLVTDVNSLIKVKSENDVTEKRKQLIEYIWKDKGFPVKGPSEIVTDINDDRYSDMVNLETIDKLIVTMDYGLNSVVYHFHPVEGNNKLVIYHQGHKGDFIKGRETIQFFLENGYQVLAFAMPLLGMNNTPTVDLKRFGTVRIFRHDQFFYLDSSAHSSIKYYLEPVAVALNYIKAKFDYDSFFMTGISGGGWTTTLYAAIDPTIKKSYPVAGTQPLYHALELFDSLGHYETAIVEFYRIANSLELYILGSYGNGRKQLQVFNQFDPCCAYGINYRTYENQVKSIVSQLGKGAFDIFLDDTHREHKISEHALRAIINDMEDTKLN